jgi:hypothetical protein
MMRIILSLGIGLVSLFIYQQSVSPIYAGLITVETATSTPVTVSATTSNGMIEVVSAEATSDFPRGINFRVEIKSDIVIEEIALRMKIGQQKSGVYEYFDIEPSKTVSADMFWNTNTSSRYIPPGTVISYSLEVSARDGLTLETKPTEIVLHDVRFEWKEIEFETISVAYHGPVESRAEEVLNAIVTTMSFMEPVLGESQEDPIRVTMYNNVKEMLVALPPGSSTIRRELITEGQAFNNIGTLLVLGGGRLSTGTASHEVTHILVHRAGQSVFGNVPDWLHEGLAEFGNVSPSFSYDIALDFAVHSGRILPITSMPGKPGNPEDVIIYYGQASSLIEYMITRYGPGKMRELLADLKSGSNIDDAMTNVYEKKKIEIENGWRKHIGAPEYEMPDGSSILPTPLPRPTVAVFSLTPQAGSKAVTSLKSVKPTPTPNLDRGSESSSLDSNAQIENLPDARDCGVSMIHNRVNGSIFLLMGLTVGIAARRRGRIK